MNAHTPHTVDSTWLAQEGKIAPHGEDSILQGGERSEGTSGSLCPLFWVTGGFNFTGVGMDSIGIKSQDRIEPRMSADHIHFFLQLRTQIKLYHWQTRVYARHIATDQILEKLDKAIDSFVEIYLGKYGRNRLTGKNATFTVHNLTEAGAVKLIHSAVKYIQGALTKSLKENDTDLANLRDEMVGELHQLLYLFSLH